MSHIRNLRKYKYLTMFSILWLATSIYGLTAMQKYSVSPGPTGKLAGQWPAQSRIEISQNQPTLIMFAHPQCPCSRASLTELNRLLSQAQGLVQTYLVFYKPKKFADKWLKSTTWNTANALASAIPSVKVVIDEDGFEAKLFGAETSGHVMTFTPTGARIFSGGITPSRGHEGESAGKTAILAHLRDGLANPSTTESFGCTLFHDGRGVASSAEDSPGVADASLD